MHKQKLTSLALPPVCWGKLQKVLKKQKRELVPCVQAPSPVAAMFEGRLESTVTCGGCGRVSRTAEPFRDLQLQIPKGRAVSLQVFCSACPRLAFLTRCGQYFFLSLPPPLPPLPLLTPPLRLTKTNLRYLLDTQR